MSNLIENQVDFLKKSSQNITAFDRFTVKPAQATISSHLNFWNSLLLHTCPPSHIRQSESFRRVRFLCSKPCQWPLILERKAKTLKWHTVPCICLQSSLTSSSVTFCCFSYSRSPQRHWSLCSSLNLPSVFPLGASSLDAYTTGTLPFLVFTKCVCSVAPSCLTLSWPHGL